MLRNVLFSLPAATIVLFASYADAGGGCRSGCNTGCGVGGVSVCRDADGNVKVTVMCPVKSVKKCTRTETRYKTETRTRTCNVVRLVPETKQIQENYTVLVPHKKTRTVTYTVRCPVTKMVPVTYTVRVPKIEKRTGYRIVRKVVCVPGTRTVTVRGGHWETRSHTFCSTDRCGCPITCTCCRRCWVPTCCTKQVPTCCKKIVCERVPCTYCVTTYCCETRTKMCCRTTYVCKQRTREVCYTCYTRECRTRTRCVTTCRRVCEQKTQEYCVRVPYCVEVPYEVTVCRMVPKTVTITCDVDEGADGFSDAGV